MSLPDDRSFLDRLAQADSQCIEITLEHYQPKLLLFVSKLLPKSLGRRLDPDDVVQEAMLSFTLRVRRGGCQFPDLPAVDALLLAIARVKLIEKVREHRAGCRKVASERPLPTNGELARESSELADPNPDPLRCAIAADILQRLFQKLPDVHCEIVRFHGESYTNDEIAVMVNRSTRFVNHALAQARGRVRRLLDD